MRALGQARTAGMQAAPRHAAGPSRQRHSSAAHSGSRIRHIAYIAAPTTLADTQTAWAPAVSEQRQQPALLPRAADPAEQQGPLQQQWNWRWGSSITYTQAGCAIDGRPALLLLHGFGVSHKHFVHNIEVLAEQYTVSYGCGHHISQHTNLGDQHHNIVCMCSVNACDKMGVG